MQAFLKGVWMILVCFSLLGFLALVPYGKMHNAFQTEIDRYKAEPQRRVNATLKYIEAIESGEEQADNFWSLPPDKYYEPYLPKIKEPVQIVKEEPYKYPRYVRDKNNPKKLYKYRRR